MKLGISYLVVAAALAFVGYGQAQTAPSSDTEPAKASMDASLEVGTVLVVVVDGDAGKPLADQTVELVGAEGKKVAARTNPEGRATFRGLSVGAAHVGRVVVERKQGASLTLSTEPFRVPSSGGLRFMLSPKPLEDGARASTAPRMDPRRASGIPRAEPQDPPGRLTVRAVLGEFHPTDSRAPVGAKIHLIGFGADGTVTKTSKVMDESERVVFDGLVTGGRMVYYVTSLFDRDGDVDRLVSQAITLPPRVGMRLLLAGHLAGSGKPAVDDMVTQESLPAPTPGRVIVRAGGQDIEGVAAVELVEVGRPDVIVKSPLRPPVPSADEVRGVARAPTPVDGSELRVLAQRVTMGASKPLVSASVHLRSVESGKSLASGITASDGRVVLPAAPKVWQAHQRLVLEAEVHGKTIRSDAFGWPASGGLAIVVDTAWQVSGAQADFENVSASEDRVYLARLEAHGRVFRSTPFQLSPGHGAAVNMLIFPGLIFAFHGGGEIDDKHFWFQSQMTLFNPGRQPYMPESGRVEIPLPVGFVNAKVDDSMSSRVQVAGEGLSWRGPVPPGPTSFISTFALPVIEGEVEYDMLLPMGAFQGQLIVRPTPGITLLDENGKAPVERTTAQGVVKMLGDAALRETQDRDGRPLLVLSNITVRPNGHYQVSIRGLPQPAAWRTWVNIAVGVVVLALMGWGLLGLFRGAGGDAPAVGADLERQRDDLLERLVVLEKREDYEEASVVRADLQSLYRKLGTRGD